MQGNFFEITGSIYIKRKDVARFPLMQLMRSLVSTSHEKDLVAYQSVKDCVDSHGEVKASKILGTLENTCFVTQKDKGVNYCNTHLIIFLMLLILNFNNQKNVSLDFLENEFGFFNTNFKKYLKELNKIKCCYYDFSQRQFYDNIAVFKDLSLKNDFLTFDFSFTFKNTFLKSGKKIFIPKSLFRCIGKDRNGLTVMSFLNIFLEQRVQNTIAKKDEYLEIPIKFGIQEYLKLCGINVNKRFYDIKRYLTTTLLKLLEEESIKKIKIKNYKESQVLFDRYSNSLDKENERKIKTFIKKQNSKQELLACYITLYIVINL